MPPRARLIRSVHVAAAVGVLGLISAAAVAEVAPIEESPDALTARDVSVAARQMWQPVVLDGYLAAANPDHPSHEAIEAFLQQIAHRLTDTAGVPLWRDLRSTAADMLDQGVDNPHIHGWYAHALALAGDMAEAEPHARTAADALLDDQHTPFMLQALTAQRMNWIYKRLDRDDEAETYRDQAADLYLRALADELPDDDLQQRAMVQWIWNDSIQHLPPEEQKRVHERCIEQEADVWATDLLGGLAHLRLGRQIIEKHGPGPLSLELGTAYHRHMTDARRYLLQAHQRHPDRPEAAAWLIEVAAHGYAPPGTSHRHWFTHATAAQFDYIPAYHRMIDALHPHRVGSQSDLLDFGLACLATERFDTEVPYQLFRTVQKHAELLGGDYEGAFSREDVADKLLRMLVGYRGQPNRQHERAWFDSFIAAVAWRAGRMDVAWEALSRTGEDVSDLREKAFRRVHAVPQRAMGEIVARGGGLGRITRELERAAEQGQHDVALVEFEDLADRNREHPHLRQFFEHLARRTRIERDLLFGEADLTPGADLAGWVPMTGDWSVEEDGALVGRSTSQGLWIVCDVPIGMNIEFTAEVAFDEQTLQTQPNAGLFFGYRPGESFHTFFVDHASGAAHLNRGLWGGGEANARLERVNTLRLVIRNQRIYAFVNGRPVFSNEAPRRLGNHDSARIGLGGRYGGPGAVVRFRDIRARRIEERGSVGARSSPLPLAFHLSPAGEDE